MTTTIQKVRAMTWRQFGLGLIDAAINSAASSCVVVIVDPNDFNFGDGLWNLCRVFSAGAILGALLWLKNHRLPGIESEP